jgi:hypothetical protein
MKRSLACSVRSIALTSTFAAFVLGTVVSGALGCAGDLDPSLIATGAAGTGSGTVGSAGMTGSAGTTGNAGTSGVCDAPKTVLASNTCALVGCHSANTVGGAGLDFVSAGVVGRLLNVGPSSNTTAGAMCQSAGKPYLVPGTNPAAGLLFDKLSQSTLNCGLPMPVIGMLSDMQIGCLNDWATAVTTGVITQ